MADSQTTVLARALFPPPPPSSSSSSESAPLVVVVRGIMGSGKSTLVRKLGMALVLERLKRGSQDDLFVGTENTWKNITFTEPDFTATLCDYYAAPSETAFSFQMAALQQRLRTLSDVPRHLWEQRPLVVLRDGDSLVDRMFELARYRRGDISLFQHSEYLRAFHLVKAEEPKPDIVVMLEISSVDALARIRARARPGEESITLSYLQELNAAQDDLREGTAASETQTYVHVPSTLSQQAAITLILCKIGSPP